MPAGSTMYQRAGGDAFFEALTKRFYEGVAGDPVLRPLYPAGETGLERSRKHLELFLIQHFGGPRVYESERGEPRLGQRHRRFAIGERERDAWLTHMTEAVKAGRLSPLDETQVLSYFRATAQHLMNQPSEARGSHVGG